MGAPMKIRAQLEGTKANVRILMNHEMESGQRRDAAGNIIPAFYITEVKALLNGKEVFRADWGPSISKNPYLQFYIKNAQKGDKLTVIWRDNKDDTRTDETIVG